MCLFQFVCDILQATKDGKDVQTYTLCTLLTHLKFPTCSVYSLFCYAIVLYLEMGTDYSPWFHVSAVTRSKCIQVHTCTMYVCQVSILNHIHSQKHTQYTVTHTLAHTHTHTHTYIHHSDVYIHTPLWSNLKGINKDFIDLIMACTRTHTHTHTHTHYTHRQTTHMHTHTHTTYTHTHTRTRTHTHTHTHTHTLNKKCTCNSQQSKKLLAFYLKKSYIHVPVCS